MTTIRENNLIRLPRAIASAIPSRAVSDAGAARVPGWAVVSAVLAPVVLASSWLIADALQAGSYSPMKQTVSVLAGYGGTHRWLMTSGLLVVGACYFVTAAGMRGSPTAVRVVLLVTGLASLGVAVSPQPVHGSSTPHMIWTALGELSLACFPAVAQLHRLDHRLFSAWVSGLVVALFTAMFIWLVMELRDGAHLGLAERLTSSVQACWPFVVALALRDATRKSQRGRFNATWNRP
jgi:hypothetical membrane protein